jgi:hypothetical protein
MNGPFDKIAYTTKPFSIDILLVVRNVHHVALYSVGLHLAHPPSVAVVPFLPIAFVEYTM